MVSSLSVHHRALAHDLDACVTAEFLRDTVGVAAQLRRRETTLSGLDLTVVHDLAAHAPHVSAAVLNGLRLRRGPGRARTEQQRDDQ